MREIVKVREVAGSVVVTLPQSILEPVGLEPGDRVILEASPPRRIVLTKESESMQSTARLELEIDLLEKKKRALGSDLQYKGRQYNWNMPCEEGLSDPNVAMLMFAQLERDLARLEANIAEKKLELYDLQGADSSRTDTGVQRPDNNPPERAGESAGETHAAQIFRAAATLAGPDGNGTFSRMAVRDALRLTNREWQTGYTAIFQSMRDDHPGGAPTIGPDYSDVFHRLSQGTYELSGKGRTVARRVASSIVPKLTDSAPPTDAGSPPLSSRQP